MNRRLDVRWLGTLPYGEASRLQDDMVEARRLQRVPDTLLLLEHTPVITLGRGAHAEHVLLDRAALRSRGIEVHVCGRGGDVTYHGPGQLVGWPIVWLGEQDRDAHAWLRLLEGTLIDTAADLGVQANAEPGLTGVFVGRRKLGAIGVRLSAGWITSHGFALNVGADLSGFETIVPCGIRDRGVTSLATELGRAPAMRDVAAGVAEHLARRLATAPRWVESERAGPHVSAATAIPA